MIKKITLGLAILTMVFTPLMTQGFGYGKRGGDGKRFDGGMAAMIATLPLEDLSDEEIIGLFHMREEEKLARDVYTTLYGIWKLRIFSNIAHSEQRHMDALKVLMDRYGLADPVTDDTVGIFHNSKLQNLYNVLVDNGKSSLVEALKVGVLIEDLDIYDLKIFLVEADNLDIRIVYQNLMKGSRNHLRVYFGQLEARGGDYIIGEYLTEEEFWAIIDSPMERGMVDSDGKPIFGPIGW